jgi:hypothetical protein
LIQQSLRSFRAIVSRIPEEIAARELFVIGGKSNEDIRTLIVDLGNIRVEYRPEIDAAEASRILSSCSFAWLDYFHRPEVPTDIILKSSAFAAVCAHGIIHIFPHRGDAISIAGDRLPGPFFVDLNSSNLPTGEEVGKLPAAFYKWYHRHAAAEHVTREIPITLGLSETR